MALRERAALASPDRRAAQENPRRAAPRRPEPRRSPNRCRRPPSTAALRLSRKALDRLVDVEALRNAGDAFGEPLQPVLVDGGFAAPIVVGNIGGGFDASPAAVQPVGLVGRIMLAGLEFGVEPATPVGAHSLALVVADDALGRQLLGVDLQSRRMRLDLAVHQRLGERGLVALVVAVAPIAEHVDDDRLVELLPEFRRDLRHINHRLRIVAVDVEDRRLDQLGDVGRIGRGARIARVGGEADLVVDDEMQASRRCDDRAGLTGRSIPRRRPGPRKPRRRGSARASPSRARCNRSTDPAWRAPCPAPRDRRSRDARGWGSATDARCCRRTRGPTRRPGDI